MQLLSFLVIAQLVAFVEFNHSTIKLADLRKLYDRRLNQLVSDWIGVYMHQKRFKEHILEKLGPDWSEYSEGRDVYVSHKKIIWHRMLTFRCPKMRLRQSLMLVSCCADTFFCNRCRLMDHSTQVV